MWTTPLESGDSLHHVIGRELRWMVERGALALTPRAITRIVAAALLAGRLLTVENEIYVDALLECHVGRGELPPRALVQALLRGNETSPFVQHAT